MGYNLSIFILILPLLSFLINGLFSARLKGSTAGIIGVFSLATITLLSVFIGLTYFTSGSPYEPIIVNEYLWLQFTETLNISMGILLDPISVMMLFVISSVSLMVHIYSLGYMKGEERYNQYFAFLSLFTWAMLGLVVATNLLQTYMFWELVGVSSYLLIGFFFQKPEAVAASKKAFIVTRFADFGFLIGILMISNLFNTFSYHELSSQSNILSVSSSMSAGFLGFSVLGWALILIFIGGAGKSAMFPFHVWLPDAMEGPTPVSALIHAATMVVAGVYLVARLFTLYSFGAPDVLVIVAFVGMFTSLFAAILACVQNDIKKVLAYSTISQIGYMMLALGSSGYGSESGLGFTASMFHLFTHAFFKALLFLGAGSIIHAVHSNNMNDMGNLRKKIPVTHATFIIAVLAISGIPPFAGFFSKDEILSSALSFNLAYFIVSWLVAGITAFYMFRLYFKVFWSNSKSYENIHESPNAMLGPMVALSIGAIFAGLIPFSNFVTSDGVAFESHLHLNVALLSIGVAALGIFIAFFLFKNNSDKAEILQKRLGPVYTLAKHKFYIDDIYLFFTKSVVFKLISQPIAWFDRNIVDGFMNLIGKTTEGTSQKIKGFQSGQIQQYAFVFLSSVVLLIIAFYIFLIR